MKRTRLINIYMVSGLLFVAAGVLYPPHLGSGQPIPIAKVKTQRVLSYEIEQLKYDVERLREEEIKLVEKKLNESPKVVVKTKTVVKIKDSASVWLRHPDGSVERIVFATNQVPVIDLVSDTLTDTVKVKRKWLIFGEYRAL